MDDIAATKEHQRSKMRQSASSFKKSGITPSSDKNNQARDNVDSAFSGREEDDFKSSRMDSSRKLKDKDAFVEIAKKNPEV